MKADDFAEFFINKTNASHNFENVKEDYVFKVLGTAEYIYGDTLMIGFEHVRKCLKQKVPVDLMLVPKRSAVEEIDPLKTIKYDSSKVKNIPPKHDDINMQVKEWDEMDYISMWDLDKPLRIKIIGADNIKPNIGEATTLHYAPLETIVYFMVELYHGGQLIAERKYTRSIPFHRYARWQEYITFHDLKISQIPRETKLCMTVFASDNKRVDSTENADVPLAYVNSHIIDFKGQFTTGRQRLRAWPNEAAKPNFACVQNVGEGGLAEKDAPCVFTYEIDSFSLPVIFPSGSPPAFLKARFDEYENQRRKETSLLSEEDLCKELERIVSTDPLYQLNTEERWRIFDNRERLKNDDRALPKFLISVPWHQPYAVHIMRDALFKWKEIKSTDALELLDYNYGDSVVRQYAIDTLNKLDDIELSDFVLQLVQTLKYELYTESALARFLLERSLRNTHLIGHILFWHLKAEMHVPYIRERFGLILEEYLKNCGSHRRDLLKQSGIVDQLTRIANAIKEAKKGEMLLILRSMLSKLQHPPKFKLPLSPRLEVKGVIPEKCKVMDSKKLPLWLVFENADESAPPVYVMFKAGDDIRQDMLTLQMFRYMDQLWKGEGLDLHMQPYGCVCLGDMVGMIEIVLNSDTIANITAGSGGATAALSQYPIYSWLKAQNPKNSDWDAVVNNFVLSCAGYCVATYVLGIGDRHNDNIMLTKRGDLFHIDFGHFLGNFKTFKGVYKRETTPFVFTPMYAHVMGGQDAEAYNRYTELSCKAFHIIRKHGRVIMNLFLLMLATGIPELRSIEDVMWLRKCLILNKSEADSHVHFKEQIRKSLSNTRAQVNDLIHILVHNKK
ncbi:phosphatidylinositol 3-kinase [Acrasis kona]|uniref:phosphatidylinositol 3-kinase n=1 Tax=Acrasis kona TaxID=1008807 RepID=A0AAW2YNL2_9EUKA